MRFRFASRRSSRRRNSGVLAIVRRVADFAGRQHPAARRAVLHDADHDLAQRVRASGEW